MTETPIQWKRSCYSKVGQGLLYCLRSVADNSWLMLIRREPGQWDVTSYCDLFYSRIEPNHWVQYVVEQDDTISHEEVLSSSRCLALEQMERDVESWLAEMIVADE